MWWRSGICGVRVVRSDGLLEVEERNGGLV